jgi:hypothetical protein
MSNRTPYLLGILIFVSIFSLSIKVAIDKKETKDRPIYTIDESKAQIKKEFSELSLNSYFCLIDGFETNQNMKSENCQLYLQHLTVVDTHLLNILTYIQEHRNDCESDYNLKVLNDLQKVADLVDTLKSTAHINTNRLDEVGSSMVQFVDSIDYHSCTFHAVSNY